jgi:hypothetical protein
MEAGGGQGRRRVLAPGDAPPAEGFYERRTHRPSNHTKLRETERIYKNKQSHMSETPAFACLSRSIHLLCRGDWPELLDLSGERGTLNPKP